MCIIHTDHHDMWHIYAYLYGIESRDYIAYIEILKDTTYRLHVYPKGHTSSNYIYL